MKECDSRSWIGGEEIPSRYHTIQGEDKEEVATGGFLQIEDKGKCSVIHKLLYNISIHVHKFQ
jgi:hypothetical protein